MLNLNWRSNLNRSANLNLMRLSRLSLVAYIGSISMHVVRRIFHNLNSSIWHVNSIASMNCSIFLLLRVRKVIAGQAILDCIGESILFLVVIIEGNWRCSNMMDWRRRLEVVQVNSIDMFRTRWNDWRLLLLLQLIVIHFSSVIRKCGEDLWRLIVLKSVCDEKWKKN